MGALPQDPYSLTFKAGYFLEQRLTDTARLAHQRAPGILLPLPPQGWDYDRALTTSRQKTDDGENDGP